MNPRTKKFIGTIILILFVAFYVLLILAIAPRVLSGDNKAVEMAFYVIAGLAWVVPMMPLIKWMEKRAQ